MQNNGTCLQITVDQGTVDLSQEFTRLLKIIFSVLVCVSVLMSQTAPNASLIPGFDVKAMDKTADPCKDFYQYACGTWIKNNPTPPDQSRWGRFSELEDRNRDVLHQILETAAKPTPARDAVTQTLGDYYAASMDDKAIDPKRIA